MAHELTPFIPLFRFHDMMFAGALSALDDEQSAKRIHPDTNTFKQNAAHLLIARRMLCDVLGIQTDDFPWKGFEVQGGDSGFNSDIDMPSNQDLIDAWAKLSENLYSGIENVSDDILSNESPLKAPGVEQIRHFVALNPTHEAYHLGQMGLMVKAFTGQQLMNPEAAHEAGS